MLLQVVQRARVRLPGDVTGNGGGGTEGNGQYISVDRPASLLLVAGQVPHRHRPIATAADRGPPVRADRHRSGPGRRGR